MNSTLAIVVCCIICYLLILLIDDQFKILRGKKISVSFQKKTENKRLTSFLEIEEREKERIYRNFHDQVNPMLRFVMRRLEMHRIELTKNTLQIDSLNEDIDMLLNVLDSIKACTYEQSPDFLAKNGLHASLEYIVRKLNSDSGITTSFASSLWDQKLNFNTQDELNIYRITLEIINNVLQHAHCTNILVNINKVDKTLTIKIVHDGKGITNLQVSRLIDCGSGYGLKSCKARAISLGATIDYQFLPLASYILIKIPYTK